MDYLQIVKMVSVLLITMIPFGLLLFSFYKNKSLLVPKVSILALATLLPLFYLVSALFASDTPKALLNYNFTTDSFVVILLGFLLLLSVVFYSIKYKGLYKKKVIFIISATVLVLNSIFIVDDALFKSKITNTLQDVVGAQSVTVRPSWQGTLDIGNASWGESKRELLFGSGPGSFGEQWRIHKSLEVNNTQFWGVEFPNGIGFIPTTITTGGLLVGIVWLLFLLSIVYYVVITRSMLSFATVSLWLLAILQPVDMLVLMLAFAFTGLFIIELSKLQYIKIIKINVPDSKIGILIVKGVITFLLFSIVISSLFVLHRAVVTVYIQKSVQSLVSQNTQEAESDLNMIRKFTRNAVVERLYTTIALRQLNALVIDRTGTALEPSQEDLQAALSNVIAHAQRAIELEPSNPTNYIALGTISEQLLQMNIEGAYDAAITAYGHAERLDAKNPAIPYALARVYLTQQDRENVIKYLERTIELKSNHTDAIYAYGLIKLEAGNATTAIAAFGSLAQAYPNYSNALYYLAMALAQEGRYEETLALMQKVSRLNPENADVKRIISDLQSSLAPQAAAEDEE